MGSAPQKEPLTTGVAMMPGRGPGLVTAGVHLTLVMWTRLVVVGGEVSRDRLMSELFRKGGALRPESQIIIVRKRRVSG